MKRVLFALAFSFTFFIAGTGIALADEYTVVISIDGEPMTLTVEADSGLSVADIDVVSVEAVTSEVVGKRYTVLRSANLRAGPGTSFAVSGSAVGGDVVTVVGSNADNSWYELDNGDWVAAFLVEAVGKAPAPSPTPRAPSVPTRPPLPTAIPTKVEPTVSVREYETKVTEIMTSYGESLSRIGELFSLAGENPAIIFTDEWVIAGGVQVAVIRALGENLRALVPPAQYAEVHKLLVTAASHFDTATVLITEGVDNLDAQKLSEANRQMLLGASYIQEATSLFD